MLQSSAKERRAIFEEASGISRFKAKKIEALCRLERVEQNLLRLSDIVDEVESRLKSVRAQATKARRYKEHADRLQQLRTQVGLADWRTLDEKLSGWKTKRRRFAKRLPPKLLPHRPPKAQVVSLEADAAKFDGHIHAIEARSAENRDRTASLETTIEHERTRVVDLEDQAARHRKQLQALSNRAVDLAGLWQSTTAGRPRKRSTANWALRLRRSTASANGTHRATGPNSSPKTNNAAPRIWNNSVPAPHSRTKLARSKAGFRGRKKHANAAVNDLPIHSRHGSGTARNGVAH